MLVLLTLISVVFSQPTFFLAALKVKDHPGSDGHGSFSLQLQLLNTNGGVLKSLQPPALSNLTYSPQSGRPAFSLSGKPLLFKGLGETVVQEFFVSNTWGELYRLTYEVTSHTFQDLRFRAILYPNENDGYSEFQNSQYNPLLDNYVGTTSCGRSATKCIRSFAFDELNPTMTHLYGGSVFADVPRSSTSHSIISQTSGGPSIFQWWFPTVPSWMRRYPEIFCLTQQNSCRNCSVQTSITMSNITTEDGTLTTAKFLKLIFTDYKSPMLGIASDEQGLFIAQFFDSTHPGKYAITQRISKSACAKFVSAVYVDFENPEILFFCNGDEQTSKSFITGFDLQTSEFHVVATYDDGFGFYDAGGYSFNTAVKDLSAP